MSSEKDIESIEEEIRKTPYHKATQAHIGRLKAKLARLREAGEKGEGGGHAAGAGYSVRKSGDATVLLVGFPSVGKSTLINRLTKAESKTAEYDFTTLDVIPGMLEHNGAKIQMLDIPGMIAGASKGKGRGRQLLSVVRNADLILLVVDDMGQLEQIRLELHDAGFRLDQKRPDVSIVKKDTGGLGINLAVKNPKLGLDAIRSVLQEFKVHNADVLIREDVSVDQLIDAIASNRVYVPSIVVLNKTDRMEGIGFRTKGKDAAGAIPISALKGHNIGKLKDAIWGKLELLRIYLKRIGKDPDMQEPFILPKGTTVTGVAEKVLKKHAKGLKYARIWGPSARFGGQHVGGRHLLRDKDIVELHA
ncbi:MAG: GTP-binding protein [Candidatus Aenigmarchaeota archaeon]|nr:GTP-binding protein [Candidatus Aenigmarchaeota archaeon]